MNRVHGKRRPLVTADILVLGGGAAGLWVLQRVLDAGWTAVLVEQDVLGGAQTGATQGIIHGGVKYALGGRLTPASKAIADMPRRWRACLAGRGEIDLRRVEILADAFHLIAVGHGDRALASVVASPALRDRVTPLTPGTYPPWLRNEAFRGSVCRLDEPVLDPASLVATLATANLSSIVRLEGVAERLSVTAEGFRLRAPSLTLQARQLILAAGTGNETLLAALGRAGPAMQRRPLQQVCAELHHPLPVYGHCVGEGAAAAPDLTLTSYPLDRNRWLLYLGGQLAEAGAERAEAQQIASARELLADLLPWLHPHLERWRCLRIDRAEPALGGTRPDEAFIHAEGGVITLWPTKLALLPELGERTLAHLRGRPEGGASAQRSLIEHLTDLPRPAVGRPLQAYLS